MAEWMVVEWPTWDQALVVAIVSALLASIATRRRPHPIADSVAPAAREFACVAALYSIWRMARNLPLEKADGAIERAYDIVRLEDALHLPSELALQAFVLDHDSLARFSVAYYAVAHVPALVAFLVWLYWRHRDVYPHWRNALAILTGFC